MPIGHKHMYNENHFLNAWMWATVSTQSATSVIASTVVPATERITLVEGNGNTWRETNATKLAQHSAWKWIVLITTSHSCAVVLTREDFSTMAKIDSKSETFAGTSAIMPANTIERRALACPRSHFASLTALHATSWLQTRCLAKRWRTAPMAICCALAALCSNNQCACLQGFAWNSTNSKCQSNFHGFIVPVIKSSNSPLLCSEIQYCGRSGSDAVCNSAHTTCEDGTATRATTAPATIRSTNSFQRPSRVAVH